MKTYNRRFVSLVALASILAAFLGSGYVLDQKDAKALDQQSASAQRIVGHMKIKQVINMASVPAISSLAPTQNSGQKDDTITEVGIPESGGIPDDSHTHTPVRLGHSVVPNTPPIGTNFQGMSYSSTICPSLGCKNPDMALGTSSNWVLQGVNRSFAVYDAVGHLQTSWPKTFQTFFGVPSPGSCAPKGPNLFNPRAFYDPNDQRFWAEVLYNEAVRDTCPQLRSLVWIAVSQTNNPNGLWNVYSFDLTQGTQNYGDFSQFGYDQQAVYFSCDMFNLPGSTGTFQYEESFGFKKSMLEAGQTVTPYGFSNFMSNGVLVNGVQPVEVEATLGKGPNAGLFINSFDYNSGGGNCAKGCSGMTVWAIANPGTPSESLSSFLVPTSRYSNPPHADQPGCTGCLWPLDPGISGTPIWRAGQITFSLSTGINNGTQLVAGVFWGQIGVTLSSGGAITNASVAQSGYFSYSGDTSAIFPTIMPNVNGDLVMVFQETGSTIYPSAVYAVKPASFTPGQFPDGGNILKQGEASSPFPRWGDYSAVSATGASTVSVWFASEYEAANQNWSTYIGAANI